MFQRFYRETQPTSKRVEVFVDGIYCESPGSDGLDFLEIYGYLSANDTMLWNKDENHYIKVHQYSTYPIRASYVINLQFAEALELSGQLFEHDTFSDDNMGYHVHTLYSYEIKPVWTRISLRFQESDQIVVVYFNVRMLP